MYNIGLFLQTLSADINSAAVHISAIPDISISSALGIDLKSLSDSGLSDVNYTEYSLEVRY